MNEQLSAFFDGEASRNEADTVVNALLRDESLRESWSRQHWLRTTLRAHTGESAVAPDLDFSRRVMAAIAADTQHETVSPIDFATPQRTLRPRRWRGVAGLGMAAAVAGVVLMSGSPMSGSAGREMTIANTETGSASADGRQSGASTSSSGYDNGVSHWNDQLADFSTLGSRPRAGLQTVASAGFAGASRSPRTVRTSTGSNADQWSVSDPAVREELNGYLVDHSGMARSYGMSSTTPAYVRVAAYGQDATQ